MLSLFPQGLYLQMSCSCHTPGSLSCRIAVRQITTRPRARRHGAPPGSPEGRRDPASSCPGARTPARPSQCQIALEETAGQSNAQP